MAKRALMTWGGWDGHEPEKCVRLFAPLLRSSGFDVEIVDHLDVYLDQQKMKEVDLIVPVWTQSEIQPDQEEGLLDAIASGVGVAFLLLMTGIMVYKEAPFPAAYHFTPIAKYFQGVE